MIGETPNPENTLAIVGTYSVVESEVEEDMDSTRGESEQMKLLNATIDVSYETTNDAGDFETVVLASGSFDNRSVILTGTIEAPAQEIPSE